MEQMKLAFRLAKKANPYPNPRVGAVLVKDGQLIGVGYHHGPGRPHAEIEAIEDAKRRSKDQHAARGATLYVTLEPCSHTAKRTPPCTDAIIRHGIMTVIYGMEDPNPLVSGAAVLRKAGVNVTGPTDQEAGERINKRYIANISAKPFVAIKMAMSADGKTATRTGDSRWISCPQSRAFVHSMRSAYDAVMVGAGTIRNDDPSLTSHGKGRDPYRIIIDGSLSIPLDAKVLTRKDGKTIIVTSEKAPKEKLEKLKSRCTVLQCGKDDVDIAMLLRALGAMGIKKILIEGGSELNASAIQAGIVDKLYLFIAPKIIGGRNAKPVIGGLGIARMSEAIGLDNMRARRIGTDLFLEFNIKK
jgi:diaminohydroxyphosphoribosylaminopyrimidine deaminase / 5-amino-6-(5-phosphoribosylamino)uracil reductase